MIADSKTHNAAALDDAELDFVTGGSSATVAVNPSLLAAEKISLVQPIHLNPLPPLHTAVPHF